MTEEVRERVRLVAQAVAIATLCFLAILAGARWQRAIAILSAVLWAYMIGITDPDGVDLDGDGEDDAA